MKVACADDFFLTRLLDLGYSVWKEKSVPEDWANAVFVLIPKSGNLTSFDNWTGIALLDMVGRVVASIIRTGLQNIAEEVLPESQCGFRGSRSCTGIIFTVH